MKYILFLILFISVLSCSKSDKPQPSIPEPTNELVGTTWKYIYRQENNKDIYSIIRFKDGVQLEVSSNDNDEGTEKINEIYKYSYNETSRKVKYALDYQPFCEGAISGNSMTVTCSIQRVFKKVL
ncbi:MAG: hypothetical protein JWR35_3783 [Marmoricola sp.]|nr:hypothetical protein [Marmoricola sp.]